MTLVSVGSNLESNAFVSSRLTVCFVERVDDLDSYASLALIQGDEILRRPEFDIRANILTASDVFEL